MQRLLPYLQLTRLPNVFTAWADIGMAALVAGALPIHFLVEGQPPSADGQNGASPFLHLLAHVPHFLFLIVSSSCLYCSGMVWNDVFDIELDKRQRPFRPLPSGKISKSTALLLASALMIVGVLSAIIVDLRPDGFRWQSTLIAILLSMCILLYDGVLKRTWLGPIAMGACRFFNVLLGMSIVSTWFPWGLIPALVVGVYIGGVTWFARTEAETSSRLWLGAAAIIMAFAVVLALTLPAAGPGNIDEDAELLLSRQVWLGQLLYPYLLIGFALLIGTPIYRAIQHPAPERVQAAVKTMIFGLVLLDAVLATAMVGPLGLIVLVLLLPANWLGQLVYST